MYCPFCLSGSVITYGDNHPVADFYCSKCSEEYQLKAKKNSFGKKVTDGQYYKMIEKKVPNFFFLNYNLDLKLVVNLFLVPKEFILPNVIEKRKPLSQNAKRHDWTGCNIILDLIPDKAKIYTVKNSIPVKEKEVRNNLLSNNYFMRINEVESRSWLSIILLIISRIKSEFFTLKDVYTFVPQLRELYPKNNNIEAKIRQQLQILRDNNIIEFIERGLYKNYK